MTSPITPARIAEMLARCEAATPGPWTAEKDRNDYPFAMSGEGVVLEEPRNVPEAGADVAFAAAARADLPDLLAWARELPGRLRILADVQSIHMRAAGLTDAARMIEAEIGGCHD